jgi:[protein-PII] uridylyltransferase
VRFALHTITGRREDRLLFDHQIRIAKQFGYEDATYTLAVEQFMQRYYRTVMDVSLLNEMLLQLFREAILNEGENTIVPLNPRFQIRNDYLEVTSDDTFVRNPSAILELFRLMQDTPEVRGVRATTIRLLGRHLWLMDEEFRQNPRHHRLFLELLRAPVGVTHELRRMNLYGVLGRYIPAFGRVVGRMQYDLFHAYTVDAHILFVLRNLRRLALPRFEHELPEMSRLFAKLQRPELAYLAALFHDIAKGRGGDHSELGGVDAEAFCLEQGLSALRRATRRLARAQPPALLGDRAEEGHLRPESHPGLRAHRRRPDAPRLPLPADRRGRARHEPEAVEFVESLAVPRLLRARAARPAPRHRVARRSRRTGRETKAKALELLPRTASAGTRARDLAPHERHLFPALCTAEVAWHTKLLADTEPEDLSLIVAVRTTVERGGNAVLTCGPHRQENFARTTACSTRWGSTSSTHASRRSMAGWASTPTSCSKTPACRSPTGSARNRSSSSCVACSRARGRPARGHAARSTRQVRMFATPTQITIGEDPMQNRTVLEIIAGDRPGLLSEIGKVFLAGQIDVNTAKIMTIGERAEDVFYITDAQGGPLVAAACERLRESIHAGARPARCATATAHSASRKP